jgi:hypothetical protein
MNLMKKLNQKTKIAPELISKYQLGLGPGYKSK